MIILDLFVLRVLLLLPLLSVVFCDTSSYSAYRISVRYVSSCPSGQYYDTALLQCSPCPANAIQKSTDKTQCDCLYNYYYGVNQGGGSLLCLPCAPNYNRSSDGFGCTTAPGTCSSSTTGNFQCESDINGALYSPSSNSADQPRFGTTRCISCDTGTQPDSTNQRCVPCASITPRLSQPQGNITCCSVNDPKLKDGICLQYVKDVNYVFLDNNQFTVPSHSLFIGQRLEAAFFLCRMNLNSATVQIGTRSLLSNATACQLLANIAAMQFYYGQNGYAYYFYDTYIWSQQVLSNNRPSIPFLTYPTTYFDEINSATYNWIPLQYNQNDLLRIKLAKYSATGQFLGLVDAEDGTILLCGGGYTEGRAAFTFGAEYKRSCNIRADTLWSSSLYDNTTFFDPYIVFTQNSVDYMLPCPVVVVNYQSTLGLYPNKNADERQWVYNRRFFLLDRVSGINTNNVLTNIHYAKSIKVMTTLASDQYIQPPLFIVEYGELGLSDIGKGTLVEVSFQSTYRMDLLSQIIGIWIATSVLSFLAVVLAFVETSLWSSRSTKSVTDYRTAFKLLLHSFDTVGTAFLIVMAGVSLWWLIFYKRQNSIALVMPTSFQLSSFTALIIIVFAFKTFDVLHIIFRQASTDIFFMDWEKSKTHVENNVSIWRTYFVANEFQEIQTHRRINVTTQLLFVLFLLKVINLENIATMEPGVNINPGATDYQPSFSSILRVGIAFSMWLATGIVQYLIYVLFYQRFVEDKIVNFIDLCSVSNISVFMLTDDMFGYYLHGLSPHGTTDVNMREMLRNLERESNQSTGARGLEDRSDDQTFIMLLTKEFYEDYSMLRKACQSLGARRRIHEANQKEIEHLMSSYRGLNTFLCQYFRRSSPRHRYEFKRRSFIAKVFNYDTAEDNSPCTLLYDHERNFTKIIFYGREYALFTWNMVTFLFFDYFALNFVLAAVLTYILNFLAERLRLSFGRRNLSAKTLIPKSFLI